MGDVSSGRQHPTAFAFGAEPCCPHEPGYPFARAADSLLTEFDMQTGTAISALMVLKSLSKLLGQLSIFSLSLADRALAPRIKATFRDVEHSAHDDDGKLLLVFFDKPIDHLLSREKMLTAF